MYYLSNGNKIYLSNTPSADLPQYTTNVLNAAELKIHVGDDNGTSYEYLQIANV